MNRQRLRVLLLLFFLGDVLGMLVTGTTSLLAVGTVFCPRLRLPCAVRGSGVEVKR